MTSTVNPDKLDALGSDRNIRNMTPVLINNINKNQM